jgi:hypothetical protein
MWSSANSSIRRDPVSIQTGFKTKDLDLICYLRFKGFRHEDYPVEDESGVRWAVFFRDKQLEKEAVKFMSGECDESRLLNNYRMARRFLLDSESIKLNKGDYNEY